MMKMDVTDNTQKVESLHSYKLAKHRLSDQIDQTIVFTGKSIEFHDCEDDVAQETYYLISKIMTKTIKSWNGPGWYLHIEDNGEWSKINYCPYCGDKLLD